MRNGNFWKMIIRQSGLTNLETIRLQRQQDWQIRRRVTKAMSEFRV